MSIFIILVGAMNVSTGTYQKIYFSGSIPGKKGVRNKIFCISAFQFFNHPEGYTKNDNGTFSYVYQYKDHLGNVRLSYADTNNDGTIDAATEIIEEKNYYPFGLEHKGYNNAVSANGNSIAQKLKTYQGQEFHDELGLNVHEWKYRISDPAIGRFWQVDPLAEDFMYNSTYAFQENKLGMGRELEGAELIPHTWLINDAVKNPNGVGAHTIGISQGLANTVTGVIDAVSNPMQTLEGMGNLLVAGASQGNPATMLALDDALGSNSFGTSMAMGQALDGAINDVTSGNGIERGTVIGEVIGAVVGTKGTTAATKTISTAIKANSKVKVFRAFGGDAKMDGFSWTPKDPRKVSNFRDAAGLPSGGASGSMNTAKNLVQGKVKNKNIIKKRPALPLDGNKGGLPEYIIDPKWRFQRN